MKWFFRKIGGLTLYIGVEEKLYTENNNLFNSILSTYTECDEIYQNLNSWNVLQISKESYENGKTYICKTNQLDWVQELTNYIEDWHAIALNCTVFHGSALIIQNKNVLILGNRKKGKTTLTGFLSIHKNFPYLDDDCVFCFEHKYIGFNMPISIRNNVDKIPKKYLVATTKDIDNIKRELYCSPFTIGCIDKIDIILFPEYKQSGKCEINVITDNKLITDMIIKNTRHHGNIKRMCQDINLLTRNSKAITLKYSSSQSAFEMLSLYFNMIAT